MMRCPADSYYQDNEIQVQEPIDTSRIDPTGRLKHGSGVVKV
jgi:hypothetical protein